ncbi:hypothetical protein EKE94_04520 [Mesobaculum littorinae]|uniref:Uncharacterized protein n=1 Tax=Mesobaculum littorinae TaxID=2486419 RepID=A0A438AN07_9RHOB|nr:hypothetical protein [Mesobaculum littorinae]RVV99926.1 hypothetical protein EKE94_04520 [Mesobaculum littorinae]
MTQGSGSDDRQGKTGAGGAQHRADRLKAALKANLGRRKAQARSRAAAPRGAQDGEAGAGPGEQDAAPDDDPGRST